MPRSGSQTRTSCVLVAYGFFRNYELLTGNECNVHPTHLERQKAAQNSCRQNRYLVNTRRATCYLSLVSCRGSLSINTTTEGHGSRAISPGVSRVRFSAFCACGRGTRAQEIFHYQRIIDRSVPAFIGDCMLGRLGSPRRSALLLRCCSCAAAAAASRLNIATNDDEENGIYQ